MVKKKQRELKDWEAEADAKIASGEKLPPKPYDEFPKLVKAGFANMVKRYADANKIKGDAEKTLKSLKDPLKDAMATLPKHQDTVLVGDKDGDIRATYCRGTSNRTIDRDALVKAVLNIDLRPEQMEAMMGAIDDSTSGGDEYFYVLVTPPKLSKEVK